MLEPELCKRIQFSADLALQELFSLWPGSAMFSGENYFLYIEQKLGQIIELLSQQDWEEIAKAWRELFEKAHGDTIRSILEEMTGYYHFRLEKKILAQSGKPYISCIVRKTEQGSEITGRGSSLIQAIIDAKNQI